MNETKNNLKIEIFLILFLLTFLGCEKDQSVEPETKISNEYTFKTLKKSNIKNEKINEFLKKVESEKSSEHLKKSVEISLNGSLSIDTTHIKYIEKGTYHSYTFIIDNSGTDKITNLLLSLNKEGKYDSYIVKYDFTQKDMESMSFEDFTNTSITIKPVDFDNTDLLLNKALDEQICIVEQVRVQRTCCNGELCYGSSSDCVVNGGTGVTYEWVTVSSDCYSVGGGGGSDGSNSEYPDDTNNTGTSGGGNEGSIVTAPNTQLYEQYQFDFKNFESGTLDSAERTYYNSNSNIKNTIDTYLIAQNFSTLSQLDCKEILDFSAKINLNFEQFRWVFNNRYSQSFQDASLYLTENTLDNNTPQSIKNFIKVAIDAWMNGGEVDLVDEIINLLTEKADCVYDKLQSNSLLRSTLKEFNGADAPVDLLLNEGDLDPGVSGETTYGDHITITLDTQDAKNSPSLWVAHTILHESIHADIFRKIRSTSLLHYDPATRTYSLPDGSRPHFPTLFDYYNDYPDNPQHNYMADYYRRAMEKGLREYAKSIGKTYPDQLYKDIAWAGLHNTNAWENMYADKVYTKNEQERILKAITNFKNSGTNECSNN